MGAIGQGDSEAIAEYSATLVGDDEDQSREAAKELGKLGRGGALALAAAARDCRASVRANVAYGIGWMGVYGIGWMGEVEREEARATITDLLGDVDFGVKAQACASLVRFGGNVDRAVVSRLVDILRDGVEAQYRNAVYSSIDAIRRIGLAAGMAAPALVDFLNRARRGDFAWAVATAIDALGEVRSCNGSDVEVLRREIDSNPAVAVRALKAYGSLANTASGDLHPLLKGVDPAIRCAAAATVARNESDVHAAGILVDLAVEGDQNLRFQALADLGDIRDLQDRFYSRLKARIDDPETGVSVLAEALNDSDCSARLAAACFIRGYGPLARATAPRFRDWLVAVDPSLRIAAARALARIAPSDEAISAMASLLDAPRTEVRKGAALAMDEFVSLPGWVISPLRALQLDSDPDVARAGSFVLGEIASRGAAY